MTETGVTMDAGFDPSTDLSCADAVVAAMQSSNTRSQEPRVVEACWVVIEKKFEVNIMIDFLLKGVRTIRCRALAIEWCNLRLATWQEQFIRFVVAECALPPH